MSVSPSINQDSNKIVSYWLFGCAGLVALTIMVGGITRLTRSGLSMTDWSLSGSLPPISPEAWTAEFERYKQFPEWQQRKSMDISEFKRIYLWEYSHRMSGRLIGLAFSLPLTYFVVARKIPKQYIARLLGILALGGCQGLVGWWMVKSGLDQKNLKAREKLKAATTETESDNKLHQEIRVSPYRLSIHLALALSSLSLLLWTGLDFSKSSPPSSSSHTIASPALLSQVSKLSRVSIASLSLLLLTSLAGSFVAGNDAGKCHNYFPKMTEHDWIPPFHELTGLEPKWRNLIENSSTVQLVHRCLAEASVGHILVSTLYLRYAKEGLWKVLPRYLKVSSVSLSVLAIIQASLGISALLTHVPISLAVLHQSCATALVGIAVWHCHNTHLYRRVIRLIK